MSISASQKTGGSSMKIKQLIPR